MAIFKTFNLRMAAVALFVAAALGASAQLPQLKGYRMYSDTWRTGEEQYGFCEIPTDGSTDIVPLTEGDPWTRFMSGGALTPDGYLGFDHQQMEDGQPLLSMWYRYDPVTFEETGGGPLDYFLSAPALTYDGSTGLIYCCAADFETGGFVFASVDPTTFVFTPIATINGNFWFAMAADGNGGLYAIDDHSDLIKVNQANGAITKVGATGVTTFSTGSMAIDSKSGRCFWTVTPAATFMGSLYEIDLATGHATQVCVFPDSDEFTGIYFDASSAEPKAPAAPTGLALAFANGSLSGTVCFDVPATLFDGSEAPEGQVQYVVRSGETEWTGSAAYGQRVEESVTVPESGDYVFAIQLSNEAGASPLAKIGMWIGFDAPEAIAQPLMTYGNGTATITWAHPTKTIHNQQPVDPAKMSYRITRQPDGAVVGETAGTTITDTPPLPEGELRAYSYEVTAIYNDGTVHEAEPVASNMMTVGTAKLPYLNDFSTPELMSHFHVIDADADGASWEYNSEMQATFATYGNWVPKDDWLVSPEFTLEGGKHYRLKFDVASMGEFYPELVEVYLLSAISPESTVMQLLEPTTVDNSLFGEGYKTIEMPFIASADANVYIGIHAISDYMAYYLYVDNFSLPRGVDVHAPATPADVAVIPAEDGTSHAKITGHAPLTQLCGDALTGQVDITIYRDGQKITTLEGINPGAEFAYDDSPAPGRYAYSVTASNAYGEGEPVVVNAFVGINTPMAPDGVVIMEDETMPGLVMLGWQAPVTDRAGQPLDPSTLTYLLVDIYGNIAEENITNCSAEVYALPAGFEQAFARFAVYAVNEVGVSVEPGYSAMMPIGFPFEGTWSESFADGQVATLVGSTTDNVGDDAQWTPSTDGADIKSADGDKGYISMRAGQLGVSAELLSPKITVDEAQPGFIHFYLYGQQGSGNTLELFVVDGSVRTPLCAVAVGDHQGWQCFEASLDAFKGKTVYFVFRGTAVTEVAMHLDAIGLTSTSGISSAAQQGFAVTVGHGWLQIAGTDGANVYAVDGRKVADNAVGRVAVPAGVYVVRSGDRSVKVIVK